MAFSKFSHVRVCGIKTVVPERFVDIDDELQFFGNNPKKLARQKKMIGYGRRYVAEKDTTVCDMAVDAAEKLLAEMSISREEIELLVFVNQSPDYVAPCDACVAHGRLGLKKSCVTLDLNLGCSGWPHALMVAHALMESGNIRTGLILAGDKPTHYAEVTNRKAAQVFSDAASATLLKYEPNGDVPSAFVCGTDGAGWDKLICPFGGVKNPVTHEVLDYSTTDAAGNLWRGTNSLMKGEDVFNFTMEVVPALINEMLGVAGWDKDSVDCFALHQANKQILETIVAKAEIPLEKTPTETFTKYANNSTNSVVTVICDQLVGRSPAKVVACAFGVGLSWGAAALDLSQMHNGGIGTYVHRVAAKSVAEKLDQCGKYFRGED